MPMIRVRLVAAMVILSLSVFGMTRMLAGVQPDPGLDDSGKRKQNRERLAPFQAFVGDWKGVGQVKRGSSDGAWTEQVRGLWKFTDQSAAIVLESDQARFFQNCELRALDKRGEFALLLLPAKAENEDRIAYRGTLRDDSELVLLADQPQPEFPARISLRIVAAGDRLVMLLEKQASPNRFTRIAEIGYTRKGSGFGQGGNGPECVVTGGYGSMKVTFNGETYFVCCTGCRDVFEDDPAGTLAEYRARKAAEKAKRSAK